MWPDRVHLEGEEIRLVPLDVSHAADLFAAADPELFRFTAQGPTEWSVAGFEQEIAKTCAIPASVPLAIIQKSTGRAVGRTTYMEIRESMRTLEIGRTWIDRAHHGTRVNPEAKFLMLRHAFESLDPPANRVQLTTA
ncbi:MAG TPA: GNAT family N-acetyltransferase, partial [Phycisphaerales bacterium]|nr:GNAT family N-acetyltransferase [Phycisphaerales bacterium]